jgi:hypothetical protein
MAGGLMQLVAYGAQDVYLTGSPEVTFFKNIYRRHTNFSVEAIEQTFNGTCDFGKTVTCEINRNGDLVTKMYLFLQLPHVEAHTSEWGYCRRLGHAIIDEVKIEIGGSEIDEHYGDWLNLWYELTRNTDQDRGYNQMIGNVPELTNVSTAAKPMHQMYIPLQFWFNRNNGLALPLIALQYHDVRLKLKLRNLGEVTNKTTGTRVPTVNIEDSFLLVDYIFLDAEERKKFAQATHEYLIEQLQFTGAESFKNSNESYRLNFNHPSKALVWAPTLAKYTSGKTFVDWAWDDDWTAARERVAKRVWLANNHTVAGTLSEDDVDEPGAAVTDSAGNVLVDAQFVFHTANVFDLENVVLLSNNLTSQHVSWTTTQWVDNTNLPNDAFTANVGSIHPGYDVRDHFTYSVHADGTGNPVKSALLQLNGHDRFQKRDGSYFNYVQPHQHWQNTPADGVNSYSFALNPMDHQPSGSCNFSRIDNTTLKLELEQAQNDDSRIRIYCLNYNVLRVMSGMGGLAYSS